MFATFGIAMRSYLDMRNIHERLETHLFQDFNPTAFHQGVEDLPWPCKISERLRATFLSLKAKGSLIIRNCTIKINGLITSSLPHLNHGFISSKGEIYLFVRKIVPT
ncbi:MAG: hypothetical protein FJY91_00385 [Candidatus Harrisonbacteria bacterium]|nr:hypothetical protein [Candidatus Harrisonbacteria bacterium]